MGCFHSKITPAAPHTDADPDADAEANTDEDAFAYAYPDTLTSSTTNGYVGSTDIKHGSARLMRMTSNERSRLSVSRRNLLDRSAHRGHSHSHSHSHSHFSSLAVLPHHFHVDPVSIDSLSKRNPCRS